VDRQLRPAARASAGSAQTRIGEDTDAEAVVRLHDVHSHHAGGALAGADDAEFTEEYWGLRLESDWNVGSTVTWVRNGTAVEDVAQVVLEADPPHRLAYTWHTFTPGWADSWGISEEFRAQVAAEPRSKVAFAIEAADGLVKLTVVHDGFEPGSIVLESVSEGWPMIISGLKTMLETRSPVAAA
jgi:uncharacterized protein YndB with AHSA1/START domain